MKKTMKKLIAVVLTVAMAMSVEVSVFAAGGTIDKNNVSIFQTEAFRDFQENGLSSVTLSDGKEKCITYEDGSSIVIGVMQENCLCMNDNNEQILRDPSDIIYNGTTTIYADFYAKLNSGVKKKEFRLLLTAKYKYGAHKLEMESVGSSIVDIDKNVTITNNYSAANYTMASSAKANIYCYVDVQYIDYETGFGGRISDQTIRASIICGPHTITVDPSSNIL